MRYAELRRLIRSGTLVQLVAFEAVARLKNFTRAGEELFMAQPTVSLHIKKLAETLGVDLLEPGSGAFALTPAGREVYAAAEDLFDRFEELEERLKSMREVKAKQIRIAIGTSAKYFAPRMIGAFWEAHPEIEVTLSVMSRRRLLHRIEAGLDDFYVLTDPPEAFLDQAKPLFTGSVDAYVRTGHPLATAKGSLKALAQYPLIVRELGSGTREATERMMGQHLSKDKVKFELESNEAIKQAVFEGVGVGFLPSVALGPDTAKDQLVKLIVPFENNARTWHILEGNVSGSHTGCQLFLNFVTRPEILQRIAPAA